MDTVHRALLLPSFHTLFGHVYTCVTAILSLPDVRVCVSKEGVRGSMCGGVCVCVSRLDSTYLLIWRG